MFAGILFQAGISLLATTSRPALKSTQPPIKCLPRALPHKAVTGWSSILTWIYDLSDNSVIMHSMIMQTTQVRYRTHIR